MLALLLAIAAQTADVQAELTQFNEAADKGIHVEESWAFEARAAAPSVSVALPASARRVRLAPNATGFSLAPDARSIVGDAFAAGERRQLTFQYDLPAPGGDASAERRFDFSLVAARFVFENVSGIQLTASEPLRRSERSVNGVDFVLWDLDALAPGRPLSLSWSGVPAHPLWPQYAAVLASILIVLLAIRAVRRGIAPGASAAGAIGQLPLSGPARRERLVRAVELVDRDHAQGKLDAEGHARRRAALVGELAVVLREIELERR